MLCLHSAGDGKTETQGHGVLSRFEDVC